MAVLVARLPLPPVCMPLPPVRMPSPTSGSYCELNSTVGPDDSLASNAVASLRMLANYSRR